MYYEDEGFYNTAVYEHFITGRTSFIQWMFSKEGLGEHSGATWHMWEGNAGGRAMPWHYGQGAGMGQQNSSGYGWADRGDNQHTQKYSQYSGYQIKK